ncbi:M23 family metallopeptidase [Metallumcola ferriviriculae]|uniref:M23 family metallopeptidase n=1 Tax=Metallumcola ferriviriculae TaxID=3039180 RepID=A0AAU0UPW7_9FIRM|nr:M23 family metallopeptidase [Desulfitibacteraceae bacterium MK1]
MGRKYRNRRLMAVASMLVMVITFFWYQSAVQAYEIVVDGKPVAQVKEREEFLTALEEYKEQLSKQSGYPVKEIGKIEVRESKLDKQRLENDINKVIVKSVKLGTPGYRFKVDGKSLFAVRDKEKMEQLLEEYKSQYLTGIDENAEIKSTDFKQKVEIEEALVRPAEIWQWDRIKELIYEKEREARIVEVDKGDNLWLIARRYDMGLDELEMLNPDIDPEKVFPGDKLVVKPFDPKFDVVVTLENTISEPVPFETEYRKDDSLYRRQKIVVKPGVEGKQNVTYDIAMLNGLESTMNVVNTQVLEEPVTRIVRVGTKQTVSRGGQRNYGVVQGRRVSSGYGWRTHPITGRRSFHDGLDIAARYGTGAFAYAEGKVTFAGWGGGYGRVIYIDHGNGLQTRYAHLSKINVRVGERVDTGEKIGAVGSTGNSTGSHLHFEVRQNGSTRNPWNYL